MVLDVSDHGSKSTPKNPIIDTKKLLSNYNRKTRSKSGDNGIKSIFQKLNLPNSVQEIFQQHEIDFEAFELLRRSDLIEMGIKDTKIIEIILSEVTSNKKSSKP